MDVAAVIASAGSITGFRPPDRHVAESGALLRTEPGNPRPALALPADLDLPAHGLIGLREPDAEQAVVELRLDAFGMHRTWQGEGPAGCPDSAVMADWAGTLLAAVGIAAAHRPARR